MRRLLLSASALVLASCNGATAGDSADRAMAMPAQDASERTAFDTASLGTFDEPWALAFAPGTPMLFVTEKAGTMKFVDTRTGKIGTVSGLPDVDYGGQGGLGDVAFLPGETSGELSRRTIYLSWVEAGGGDTRGAVVGRGMLICEEADACRIDGLDVIWRQAPKVTGRGHYSHRIRFSPAGETLFIASGERQKLEPAQDTSNTLGTIVRLLPDGTPHPDNPMAGRGSPQDQIYSWGHRNILGMDFDGEGRLWEIEHGPAGGDELNLVREGANYGWPVRSNGKHYDGRPIADHTADDGFAKPAISWTPVIAPGGMVVYDGDAFPGWSGDLLIAGLKPEELIEVSLNGTRAVEQARYDFDARLRDVTQGADGAIYVIEDGEGGRLLRLTPG